jgi:hypothetical protein
MADRNFQSSGSPKPETRESVIHRIGQELAAKMPNLYGSIRFNLQGGHYANANIEESVKPDGVSGNGKADKRTG